jgi:hypothetical protein
MRKMFAFALLVIITVSCTEQESQMLKVSFEFSTEQLQEGKNELQADDMPSYELFEQGTMRDSIRITAIQLMSISFIPDPSWEEVVATYNLQLKRPNGDELLIMDEKPVDSDTINRSFEADPLELKSFLEHDDASLVLQMNSYKNKEGFGRARLRFNLDITFEEDKP